MSNKKTKKTTFYPFMGFSVFFVGDTLVKNTNITMP